MPDERRFEIRGLDRGPAFRFEFEGREMTGFRGETIAGALAAAGVRTFGRTNGGEARGLFCGMGACFECVVEVEGAGRVPACTTTVEPGMKIRCLKRCGKLKLQ